jgi:septum formation protein
MPTRVQLILASSSPRRAELLRQVGLRFTVAPADIDESRRFGERFEDYALRLAREKAEAILGRADEHGFDATLPVLGADTVVVLDGGMIGKPRDPDDARTMLRRLSGRTHEVLTAVAVATRDAACRVALSRSRVTFRSITEVEIVAYSNLREPLDKAGAYGVQGVGSIFVDRIEGSYSGVMGLPLLETEALLSAFGVDTWRYRGD